MENLCEAAKKKVKEACRAYWINKDMSIFAFNTRYDDIPRIGLRKPNWKKQYDIAREYYTALEQAENLVLVSGVLTVRNKKQIEENDAFLVNITVTCTSVFDEEKNEEKIEFRSIHMSKDENSNVIARNQRMEDVYYLNVIKHLYDVVMEYQINGNIFTYDKQAYNKMFGYDTDFINMDQWFWHMCTESLHPEDGETLDVFRDVDIEKRIKQHKNVIKKKVRIKNGEGEYIWIKMAIILIENEFKTNMESIFILMKDINEDFSNQLKTQMQARIDGLTNIYNRNYTELLINRYLEKNNGGAFVIFDVDKFKSINDTFGHITGDEVLKTIAKNISKLVRADDVWGRIGGDEFVLLMSGDTSLHDVNSRMAEIMKSVRFIHREKNQSIEIHCSAGVCLINNEEKNTMESLYKKADLALYEAKEAGRNTFKIRK